MATAEIHITLKPSLLDVQGATTLKALHQLGHDGVRDVRIGKYIVLEIDDTLSGELVQGQLDDMCRQLLANPVIENYDIAISGPTNEIGPRAAPGETAPIAATTQTGDTVLVPERAPHSTTAAATTVTPEQAAPVRSLGGITISEPWAVDYLTYTTMSTEERLALQQLAWQKHEGWILQQLEDRKAGWILCVGGEVIESGATSDTLPTEARMDEVGRAYDLVPWVFRRAPR